MLIISNTGKIAVCDLYTKMKDCMQFTYEDVVSIQLNKEEKQHIESLFTNIPTFKGSSVIYVGETARFIVANMS